LLAMLSLREPVRGLAEDSAGNSVASHQAGTSAAKLKEFLRFARMQRSLVHLVAGTTLSAAVSASTLVWIVSFLNRSHHMSVPKAGWLVGAFFGGVSIAAVLVGGFATDWLARRNVAYRVWLLALASLIGTPTLIATLVWPSVAGMTACFVIWSFVSNIWYGPAYGLAQTLVLTRMRATLASVMYLLTSLISAGIGPQIVGLLSDWLAPAVGTDSLRYALAIIATLHLWAMVHFIRASRTLKTDLTRAASNSVS
jgi:MFS family permease